MIAKGQRNIILLGAFAATLWRLAASSQAVTAAAISNELGWKIFSCVTGSSDQHNLFYSPVSISSLLAILCYGAAGDTLLEINNLLLPAATYTNRRRCELGPYFMSLLVTLSDYNTTNATIEVANSAWHRQELHAMFRLRGRNFDLEEFPMDTSKPVELAEQINDWVEEKSHGKLTEFIDPRDIKPNDQVYLINVLYLMGMWAEKFSTNVFMNKFTTCASCVNGTSVNVVSEKGVEYMKLETKKVPYCDLMDQYKVQAIRLPYADGDVSMTIILPKLCAMNQVADQLVNSDLFQRINRNLRPTPDLLTIVLPKFQLSEDLPIQPILGNLGLESVFSSPKGFPKLLKDTESVVLSKMTHKALLEVNEQGKVLYIYGFRLACLHNN